MDEDRVDLIFETYKGFVDRMVKANKGERSMECAMLTMAYFMQGQTDALTCDISTLRQLIQNKL